MGNCCGGGGPSDKETQNLTSDAGGTNNRARNVKAFQGEGHRLGNAADAALPRPAAASSPMQRDDDAAGTPQPIHDENLTEEDRARIRADRAAAAEARLLKQGGTSTKKKKAGNSSAPLTGPNSQPTMRWTAG